jgi:uncharacterized membrane protein YagU involved in acid resistance
MRRNPAAFAILAGGGIAGACDITYAVVFSGFHGVPAMKILQSVASGLLGKAAFEGGVPVAILGLVLHFMMALLMAAIFYAASRKLPVLTRHAIPAGLAYGLAIYLTMNFVVLPLSAWPGKFKFDLTLLIANLVVHMGFVGLPIALATRRACATSA